MSDDNSNFIKTLAIGSSNIQVPRIGVGTNHWEKGENDEEIHKVYKILLDKGVNFFDTAEIYTHGKSEQLLADCIKQNDRPSIIASKYQPSDNRRTEKDFMEALEGSLKRLNVDTIDLYYIHRPPSAQSIDDLMYYMAEAFDANKIHAVGVSNFDALQMEKGADRLEEHGLKLAANQIEYSLLHRDPEKNGVLEACKALNVSLVAYRPLSRGRLASAMMSGYSMAAESTSLNKSPLFNVLMGIAQSHDGSVSQVALNWLLSKGELVVPIPGATNVKHALQNVGALEWEMSGSEFKELEEASTIP